MLVRGRHALLLTLQQGFQVQDLPEEWKNLFKNAGVRKKERRHEPLKALEPSASQPPSRPFAKTSEEWQTP